MTPLRGRRTCRAVYGSILKGCQSVLSGEIRAKQGTRAREITPAVIPEKGAELAAKVLMNLGLRRTGVWSSRDLIFLVTEYSPFGVSSLVFLPPTHSFLFSVDGLFKCWTVYTTLHYTTHHFRWFGFFSHRALFCQKLAAFTGQEEVFLLHGGRMDEHL